jgi:hypothetical protein
MLYKRYYFREIQIWYNNAKITPVKIKAQMIM